MRSHVKTNAAMLTSNAYNEFANTQAMWDLILVHVLTEIARIKVNVLNISWLDRQSFMPSNGMTSV